MHKFNHAKDHYLHAIYDALLKEGNESVIVKNSSLANILGIKPPSVSEMLKKLEKDGLIKWFKRKGVELTSKGLERAKRIHESRLLLAKFLQDKLTINDSRIIEKIGCILEHEIIREPMLEKAIKDSIQVENKSLKV
ncbi:MAG: metal-dependent transcriptional regulator [Promethearchaeota archaeon]